MNQRAWPTDLAGVRPAPLCLVARLVKSGDEGVREYGELLVVGTIDDYCPIR